MDLDPRGHVALAQLQPLVRGLGGLGALQGLDRGLGGVGDLELGAEPALGAVGVGVGEQVRVAEVHRGVEVDVGAGGNLWEMS